MRHLLKGTALENAFSAYIYFSEKILREKSVLFWLQRAVAAVSILILFASIPIASSQITSAYHLTENITHHISFQVAYGQSEITGRLDFLPINIIETEEGVQLEWQMPESALDDPSEFQFLDWFWDNYSGYLIPITTVTVTLPESVRTENPAIALTRQEDVVWENDIPLAEVEIMLSGDGEKLPNIRPVSLELPTEPVFVLRKGRIRGTELIIIGVSPIYAADGEPRVVTEIAAMISDAILFGDDRNSQPASPLVLPSADIESEDTESAGVKKSELNATLSITSTATFESNSPLPLPSPTDDGKMISPLPLSISSRDLAVGQSTIDASAVQLTPQPTATLQTTITLQPTVTPQLTATKKATQTPTQMSKSLAIVSELNRPKLDLPIAIATTSPTITINSTNNTSSTTVLTEVQNKVADGETNNNEIAEKSPPKSLEQIWSFPRYISRTWLVLPIFFTFIWGILFVFTRKSA